jgi:hypothetical protein
VFIAQKLHQPFALDSSDMSRQAIKRELRKYLPADQWPVIEMWMK